MNTRLTVLILGAGAIALATIPHFSAVAIASPYIIAASLMGLLAFLTELKGNVKNEPSLRFARQLRIGGYAVMSLGALQVITAQQPSLLVASLVAGAAALLYTYSLFRMAPPNLLAVKSDKEASRPDEPKMTRSLALLLFTYGGALPVCLALVVIGQGRPVAFSRLSSLVEPWGASLLFVALVSAFFIRLFLTSALAAEHDPRLRNFTVYGVLALLLISTIVEGLIRRNWLLHFLAVLAIVAVATGLLAVKSGHEELNSARLRPDLSLRSSS
jgi:hypothetical protein